MFIHEAIEEANKNTSAIARKQWSAFGWCLLLTEPIFCCARNKEPACWNPTPEDLIADDWEVVE